MSETGHFFSGASGIPAPGLQWYKNGSILAGQTGSTLTIASAQGSDIGLYSLVAANVAGSVTSSVVKLTVNSTTLASTAFGPANGATGICYDTPLYLTFNGPVSIVNSGQIRIYNSTNLVTPVDTIDMSSNTVFVATLNTGIFLTNNFQPHSLFSGDSQLINYFPVIISGNTAAILSAWRCDDEQPDLHRNHGQWHCRGQHRRLISRESRIRMPGSSRPN